MDKVSNFEVIEVLNKDTKNDLYKVKNVLTNELCVWKRVPNKILKEKRHIMGALNQRIILNYPLIVKFYPLVEDMDSKRVFISMEYFSNGNLKQFIKTAIKEVQPVSEEIVIKVTFQLLTLVKANILVDTLTLKRLFFDQQLNIKSFNFNFFNSSKVLIKACDIAQIIISILQIERKFKKKYSADFISYIEMMSKDTTTEIDKYLNNSIILLKMFKYTNIQSAHLENIAHKEKLLKLKEEKLINKEHYLKIMEKKIFDKEKIIKDKLVQVELYLNSCKNKENISIDKTINHYENNDSEVEYEQSVIVETSKKLDLEKIKKPFRRSLSERRIKFKGHSPLKEMVINRQKNVKLKPKKNLTNRENDKPEYLVKSDSSGSRKSIMFGSNGIQIDETMDNCRPISWNEENKKAAFDLLRIINGGNEKQKMDLINIKHTYL